MTTRAEMNRRKEQVWDTLNQRGPAKASEIKFQLNDRSWTEAAGGWSDAKVNTALKALHTEGRVDCWGNAWGIGRVWITTPTKVPAFLIAQIEEMANERPFLKWVERAAHDDQFRRTTNPPPS